MPSPHAWPSEQKVAAAAPAPRPFLPELRQGQQLGGPVLPHQQILHQQAPGGSHLHSKGEVVMDKKGAVMSHVVKSA